MSQASVFAPQRRCGRRIEVNAEPGRFRRPPPKTASLPSESSGRISNASWVSVCAWKCARYRNTSPYPPVMFHDVPPSTEPFWPGCGATVRSGPLPCGLSSGLSANHVTDGHDRRRLSTVVRPSISAAPGKCCHFHHRHPLGRRRWPQMRVARPLLYLCCALLVQRCSHACAAAYCYLSAGI